MNAGKKAYGVDPVTNEYTAPPRVQDALSNLLAALGFTAMAQDVLDADKSAQRRYARVIEKNWPEGDRKREIVRSLLALNLL